ncbi:hypothetical protein OPQ81_003456 [Rhizoctonia solani]|nr:hypothetical protein OPQ81_003456 [Rhizoctonia solani]
MSSYPSRPKSAFVTLLTKPSYLPGVLVLHDSLVSKPVSSAEILRLRGIKIRPVEAMGPEPGKWSVDAHDSRFIDAWTKLRVFELYEYERVVLLDADMLVRKNMDELMHLELPGDDWIAGAHACACNPRRLKHYPVDWIPENCAHTPMRHPVCLSSPPQITSESPRPYGLINSGLVVCTPSPRLAGDIESFLKTSPRIHEYAFADQDLISDFFTGRWKPLPYIYNALKTSRFTHPSMWRDDEVKCVHYVLDKPWMERPTWENDVADAVRITHSWWWEALERLERRIKRDDCFGLWDLAATPRESPPPGLINKSPIPAGEISKAERKALAIAQLDELRKLRDDVASGKTFPVNDATMWIVANRYARDQPRKGENSPATTLVLTHGTGFHKEIWETTLRYLLSSPKGQASVDEIWALDAANHGDSALLNENNLGEIYEWSDHVRDILNFLINFLPDRVEYGQLERNLPQVPEKNAWGRQKRGFTHRIIVGIGHSFGGCTVAKAAIDSPKLFSSIILVDPVIYPSYVIRYYSADPLALGALIRREHWPDREAAKSGFLGSPFFRAWHPDALADYLSYAITEEDDGVRLKCPGFQEAVTFAESARLQSEVWELLPALDKRISLKWMMDSTQAWCTGGPEITQHTVWRRPENASNIKIEGAGHLIPHEAPEALAHEILEFIQTHHGAKPKL